MSKATPANGNGPPNVGKSETIREDGFASDGSSSSDVSARMDVITPHQQVEKLAERIVQVTRGLGTDAMKVVSENNGCPEIVKRELCKALDNLKKAKLAELNIALDYLKTVIPDGKPVESGKALGRAVRAVDIRDLVANCEVDITDSVDELVNWLTAKVTIPSQTLEALYEKQATFKNRDQAALTNLEKGILDRISGSSSAEPMDFGRPTMDWDDQGLPEELVKEQGELRAKVADLELKLAKAESLASSYSDKLKSLDMAKRALGCEEAEVGSRVVQLKTTEVQSRTYRAVLESKVEELQTQLNAANDPSLQVNDQRVKDLEQQLARAQSQHTAAQAELSDMRKKNKDLQDLVDAYVQKDGGGPTGRYSTVDEHLWALGFVRNTQGQLQRTAAQGFNVKQQYTAPSRYGYGPTSQCSRNAS